MPCSGTNTTFNRRPVSVSPICSMQVSARSPGHEHLSHGLPNGYKGVMAIAHLIHEARERAGLTRAELARRAGVAASTVGRIEAGTRIPATDALFERTLRRTPAERLADATRAARFVLRGRRALAQKQTKDLFADRRLAPARRNGGQVFNDRSPWNGVSPPGDRRDVSGRLESRTARRSEGSYRPFSGTAGSTSVRGKSSPLNRSGTPRLRASE